MKRTRILITGGNGLVGRNVLEHPRIDNFEVLAPRSHELDLCNYEMILGYLQQYKPDVVLHAAGKVGGIQANVRDPVGFLLDNLDMGRNIVWAARQAGVMRLMNLGSSCMYPRNHSDPLREEMVLTGELEPTNEGYALAKVITARLCDYISRTSPEFSYKTIIPCNLFGRHDKFGAESSHLVPAIIRKIHHAIAQGERNVEIWGDGNARREFMYAGDLADMLVCALERFDSVPQNLNAGLGHDFTINEYYQAVADVLGFDGGFTHDLSKPVGMARKLLDVSQLQAWGWTAQHDLRSGLTLTCEYYSKEILQ
jgi:GDP-L-fucose synthase